MDPTITGIKYDKIAQWWHEQLMHSDYGLAQLERAIRYTKHRRNALDVGCGSGGRIVKRLEEANFLVDGVDVSAKMIALARQQHANANFFHADICAWQAARQYDFIVAWDSIFHLPLHKQEYVIAKLCDMLVPQGVLLYTFGNDYGEHESDWQDDKFYYSSLGIRQNLEITLAAHCVCQHLELDQFPLPHVSLIVQKE